MSRLKEPSTYAGISSIILGVGMIADINEAPALATAVSQATPAIVSNDWFGALFIFLGGLATILKEKL